MCSISEFSAIIDRKETSFQSINPMDVRAGTLWSYGLVPSERTATDLMTYVQRKTYLTRRENVSQNYRFAAHENRIFARKGIYGRFCCVLVGY